MATTVNSAEVLATVDAYPTGTLLLVAADVSVEAGDTVITAEAIINKLDNNGSASGKIVSVYDGGGAALIIQATGSGLTLCNLPSSGKGNITFRSDLTGATNAAIAATNNLKIQVLIRY